MKTWLLLAAGSLLAGSASAEQNSTGPCEQTLAVPAALLENDPRFVIVGEVHGTDTSPEVFGDIVCGFASARPVLVHLELPVDLSEALDAYQASPDSVTLQPLLRSWIFTSEVYDGRGSKAMLALLERLGRMATSGLDVKVTAFQPNRLTLSPQHYYEIAMANNLALAAAEHPEALNLVLVGNYHARRTPDGSAQPSAASFFMPHDIVTLGDCGEGGTASVLQPGEDGTPQPGVMALRKTTEGRNRGAMSAPAARARSLTESTAPASLQQLRLARCLRRLR